MKTRQHANYTAYYFWLSFQGVMHSFLCRSMEWHRRQVYPLLNPITYRGVGGFLAQTIRLLTITLKQLYLSPLNLVTFSFDLLDTFWQNFSKIESPGSCCSCFWNQISRKIEHMNFLICLKTMEMQRGITLCQKRCFQV